MQIALGPILYYWDRDTTLRFYEEMAQTDVDTIYLGETVCSRRHVMRTADWLALAAELHGDGKEVVVSTQALLESESDLKTLRRLCSNGEFKVEVNDIAAVHLLGGATPFVIGPHINVYNRATLDLLARMGAYRWVAPLEMARATLMDLTQDLPYPMELELFAYGRMPLAFSARCFTARHYNLPKDDCQFRCMDHPAGLTLKTREDVPFLVLNGIQTQSARLYNLVDDIASVRGAGVDILRISPQPFHTGEIIKAFRAAMEGAPSDPEARARMARCMPGEACNGYWHGQAGLELVRTESAR